MFTVVVPVYNEEALLPEAIERLMKSPCQVEREWIFVDDASTDKSADLLEEYSKKYNFKFIKQPENRGKGSAVIRGFNEARGDIIMIHDADFEYDPKDVPSLLDPILKGEADVVYGSRFKKNVTQVHRTYHYFVNYFLTFLSNLMSGIYLTDMETCYKVFKSDLLKSMNLKSKRFGIEIELTAYIAKTRARVHELPIAYYPRTQLQGKKINWKDGFAALWHLFSFNFLVKFNDAFTNLPKKYHPDYYR